jgi:hypothetical protein
MSSSILRHETLAVRWRATQELAYKHEISLTGKEARADAADTR